MPSSAAVPLRRGRPPAKLQSQIRGRLLDAAWAVLLDEGFEGFSIDKVARRAHASKATLYARFAGKSALLHAALNHELERSIFLFPRYEPGRDIAASLARQCIESLRQLTSDSGRMIERVVEWLEVEAPDLPVRHTIHERARENTVRFIAQATRDGVLKGNDSTALLWLEGLLGHVKLLCTHDDIDWTAEEEWARRFVGYHLAATGYKAGQ